MYMSNFRTSFKISRLSTVSAFSLKANLEGLGHKNVRAPNYPTMSQNLSLKFIALLYYDKVNFDNVMVQKPENKSRPEKGPLI